MIAVRTVAVAETVIAIAPQQASTLRYGPVDELRVMGLRPVHRRSDTASINPRPQNVIPTVGNIPYEAIRVRGLRRYAQFRSRTSWDDAGQTCRRPRI